MPASNSVVPTSDVAMLQLAQYLQAGLNTAYDALRGTINPEYPQDVVNTIREYNAWNIQANQYPCLCVFRTQGNGEFLQYGQGQCRYYLPSMTLLDEHPGILNWVGNQIARLLSAIRRGSDTVDRVLVGDPAAFVARFSSGLNIQTGLPMAWLEFNFEFSEIGV